MSEAREVREYFTRSAPQFDALYGEERMHPIWRWINRTFRRDIYERYLLTVEHVRRYGIVSAVDVGCGSGRYATGLVQAGVRRFVGVDFSPSMIELARRATRGLAELGSASVAFTVADFHEFETDERFELAVGMGLFDYIRDPVPVLAKMRSLVTHSVVASFPSRSLYRTPIRKLRYVAKRCPVYFYREDAIDGFCARAGFARHEVTKVRGAGMDYVVTFFV